MEFEPLLFRCFGWRQPCSAWILSTADRRAAWAHQVACCGLLLSRYLLGSYPEHSRPGLYGKGETQLRICQR